MMGKFKLMFVMCNCKVVPMSCVFPLNKCMMLCNVKAYQAF